MYIVYCQNKPKSEHIVSEYIDTYFEVRLPNQSLCASALPPGSCYSGDEKKNVSLQPGPEAAIGPQAADHRPPDQTCPTHYEVPAAAEGEPSVGFVMELGESQAKA